MARVLVGKAMGFNLKDGRASHPPENLLDGGLACNLAELSNLRNESWEIALCGFGRALWLSGKLRSSAVLRAIPTSRRSSCLDPIPSRF